VSFLRRLFGAGEATATEAAETSEAGAAEPADNGLDADEAERLHEREVLRAEAERLDPLRQRQLRYSEHAWTPPAQGGERRADDEDADAGS
jgi:hypothetical protein